MLTGKPLCIDLFCGLGGWTDGFLAEGWDVVGFDIQRHMYGDHRYPAQLVLQDALTIHGSQFKNADCIVASPPCQSYSYLAMPWSRSKDPENSKAAKALRKKWETEGSDNRLFDACFRIQREAIEATRSVCNKCNGKGTYGCWQDGMPGLEWCEPCDASGWVTRHIPLIVENVRGAIPWVGQSAAQFGSFHLWGDVARIGNRVVAGSELREIQAGRGRIGMGVSPVANKGHGGTWFHRTGDDTAGDPRDVRRGADGGYYMPAVKQSAGKGDWFNKEARAEGAMARFSSRSSARKAASAMIAKIPPALSQYVARAMKP